MLNYRGYAVLWDMDGVLVDSANLHRRAWETFLSRRGIPITDEVFRLGFGKPNTQVIPGFLGNDLSDEEIRTLSEEKESCYRDLVVDDGIETTPGVRRWLKEFHDAEVRQALATSSCRANAELVIQRIGAEPYFEAIVTAEDVSRGKPFPDLFLRASELLEISPSQCLVIEDSMHGVQAAKTAGMQCLALETTHSSELLNDADLVLSNMRSLSWPLWRDLFGIVDNVADTQ